MSQPVSRPTIPDQPASVAYSPSELALFRTYTRETYRSTFGADAPPFDPSRPVKAWFDSTVDLSDPSNVAIYKVLGRDSSGALALRQLIMPASEAASVNLQGAITYPPYAPAPTAAPTRHPCSISDPPIRQARAAARATNRALANILVPAMRGARRACRRSRAARWRRASSVSSIKARSLPFDVIVTRAYDWSRRSFARRRKGNAVRAIRPRPRLPPQL